jgi:putative SOS response-associated peptidase YedK
MPAAYNVAPTQKVAAVRLPDSRRELVSLRWGLIPSWAEDPKIGSRLINARAETAADKPSFRAAFRTRRCLLPADGFYEWQKLAGGKQPFYFRRRDGRPFAFAGLWEQWRNPADEIIESCTILTTAANAVVRPVHDRMPVILDPAAYDRWLDPNVRQAELVQPLLRPCREEDLVAYAVSPWVNNPKNDDARCVAPLA